MRGDLEELLTRAETRAVAEVDGHLSIFRFTNRLEGNVWNTKPSRW